MQCVASDFSLWSGKDTNQTGSTVSQGHDLYRSTSSWILTLRSHFMDHLVNVDDLILLKITQRLVKQLDNS